MSLTIDQVIEALPYDVYEIVAKKRLKIERKQLETEIRLNPMKLLLEKEGSMITGFD
jgi:uncharacterized protein with von Willebrand factor type A (vWA) domain